MNNDMFRFVICVDVSAKSLEEGYSTLFDTMMKIDGKSFQWESTDEAYMPDGEPLTEEELSKVRMSKFQDLQDAID